MLTEGVTVGRGMSMALKIEKDEKPCSRGGSRSKQSHVLLAPHATLNMTYTVPLSFAETRYRAARKLCGVNPSG